MRQVIAVAVVAVILSIGSPAVAAPGSDSVGNYIGVTYTASGHTQWLSKGAQGYGKQGALFLTADIDFYQSGWGVKVTHRNAAHDGYVDKQRMDYRPYYKGKLWLGEPYQVDFDVSAGYEHYYGLTRHEANTTWEWVAAFKFPGICPFGTIPRYTVHYETPVSGGDVNRKVAGWVHRFGFDLPLEHPELPIPLTLLYEAALYQGLGAKGHDWGYWHVGLKSKIDICENLWFEPAIYQQVSMDKDVNKSKDVTYGIFNLVYRCK